MTAANVIPANLGTVVKDITLTLDTSIYADGDVLSDTAEITEAVRAFGQGCKIVSIAVLDEDDQGVALDVVFLKSNVSLGTKNSAPNISDANAREILGHVNIATTDYVDYGGARVATKRDIALAVKAADGKDSIFVSTITRGGTPTYTASGLKLRIGLSE